MCRFAAIAIGAKYAGAETLGHFWLGLAISAPFVLFFALESRAVYVSDARGAFPFATYRALRTSGLFAATLCIIPFVLWHAVNNGDWWVGLIIAGACADKIALHLADIDWGVYQKRERLDLMAWSNAIRGAAMLAAFLAVIPLAYWMGASQGLKPAVAIAVWVYVIAWIAIWQFYDRPRAEMGEMRSSAPTRAADVWRLAVQAFPLGVVALIVTLCDSAPRWIIEAQDDPATPVDEGAAALGYFGSMEIITRIGTLVIVQVGTAAGHRLSTLYQSDIAAFSRLAWRLAGLAIALGGATFLAFALIGKWFLNLVYGPDFAAFSDQFIVLAAGHSMVLLA
ncbi:MAG: hypothetical protein KDA32_15040, partial [Phycisphaerales bacterium]|nr:hypothetical protein [Phycisphaerales bacterium]